MDKDSQRDCLHIVDPRQLYFTPMDGTKVLKLLTGADDDEAYHSCNEGPPILTHAPKVAVKTPPEGQTLKVTKTHSMSSNGRDTGKYKTPAATAITQPSVSAGDKVMVEVAPVSNPHHDNVPNDKSHDNGDNEEEPAPEANASPPSKDRAWQLKVPVPFTPPKADLFEDVEYDRKLTEVWQSMRVQGFRTQYGLQELTHLGSKENTIYVIPCGRGHSEQGVEVCAVYGPFVIVTIRPSHSRVWCLLPECGVLPLQIRLCATSEAQFMPTGRLRHGVESGRIVEWLDEELGQ